MIKALRITTVVAALLACAFFAAPFIFTTRSDPKAAELLKAPGAIEKFSQTQNQRAEKKDTQRSPLVKQAQAFALFLNPPETKPDPEEIQSARDFRPVIVTPKFTLIGTSIHPTKPEMSLALIDEPGKGMHWVKQASQVGHLTIDQIKSGIVVVNDNGRTAEIVAERPEKISLLRNPPATDTQPGSSMPPPPEDAATQIEVPIEQITKELEAIEQQVSAGTLDPNEAAEKSAAVMEKYMAETEAARSRITSEEAKGLDQLGAKLNAQQDGGENAVVAQPPKKQVAKKPQDKSQDTAQPRPVPRQRDPRRRNIRPRGGTPSTAPQTKPSEQQ